MDPRNSVESLGGFEEQAARQTVPAAPVPGAQAQRRTAARSTAAARSSARSASARPARRVRVPKARRMRMSLVKVDPWSVAKVSFMLSIAMGIIQVGCTALLWWIMSTMGVFDRVSSLVSSAGLSGGSHGFDVMDFFGLSRVLSAVTIFSIFEVVLIVIIAVIAAFLYNVVSSLVGGVHITLGDD